MPLRVTLAELTYRAQSRADMVNSNFVSSGEWTRFANSAYSDCFDKIAQADPERYLEDLSFTVSSGSYVLPNDFYKLLRVDVIYGSTANQFYTLRKFNLLEEERYQYPGNQTPVGPAFSYRLRGNAIVFEPTNPSPSQQVRILYIPPITPLVTSADSVDGVNGWEEKIVLDMAIMALLKENATDVSPLVQERDKWDAKIQALAAERDLALPEGTIDVTRGPMGGRFWGAGGGGGWEGP